MNNSNRVASIANIIDDYVQAIRNKYTWQIWFDSLQMRVANCSWIQNMSVNLIDDDYCVRRNLFYLGNAEVKMSTYLQHIHSKSHENFILEINKFAFIPWNYRLELINCENKTSILALTFIRCQIGEFDAATGNKNRKEKSERTIVQI